MKVNWFTVFVGDLLAGLITWGFLDAIIQINPLFGRLLAFLFTFCDYAIYLWKGYNLVLWIMELF